MWRPEGTAYERIRGYFLGGIPRLLDVSSVSSYDDRAGLQTERVGTVNVRLDLLINGFQGKGCVFTSS